MGNYNSVTDKFFKCRDGIRLTWSTFYHFICNASKLGYSFRYMFFRVNKGVEFIQHLFAFNQYRPYFGNIFCIRRKSRCFNIKNNKFCIGYSICTIACIDINSVIYKVSFTAIYNLEIRIRIFFSDCITFQHSLRKPLNYAVICNCNCSVAVFICFSYGISRLYKGIHSRKFGMKMQFHPFFFRSILFFLQRKRDDVIRHNYKIAFVLIHLTVASDCKMHTGFYAFPFFNIFIIRVKQYFQVDGV